MCVCRGRGGWERRKQGWSGPQAGQWGWGTPTEAPEHHLWVPVTHGEEVPGARRVTGQQDVSQASGPAGSSTAPGIHSHLKRLAGPRARHTEAGILAWLGGRTGQPLGCRRWQGEQGLAVHPQNEQ